MKSIEILHEMTTELNDFVRDGVTDQISVADEAEWSEYSCLALAIYYANLVYLMEKAKELEQKAKELRLAIVKVANMEVK